MLCASINPGTPRATASLALLSATLISLVGCQVAATGHNLQGKRQYEQGQFAEAITSFQKALQTDPKNADALYNLGATYYRLGKQSVNGQWLQQADQYYRQSIAYDDNHTDAHRALAVLLIEQGRAAEAFDLMRSWRIRHARSPEPLIELARLHREYGDRTQAIQYLADALAIDATHARALKAMGQLREEAGQYQLALENYIRSYQSNNLQQDVAARIAALQGAATAQLPPTVQPGQNRVGDAWQHVPR